MGDTIVGLSAYIRTRFKLGADEGIAYQAVDSFVAEAARGKGMFTRLAQAFSDEAEAGSIDVIWGFPNANAAPAWFGKLGWRNHGQVPFLIKPLRAGYLLRNFGLPFDFPLTRHRDQNVAPVHHLDERISETWARFSDGIGCAVARDECFLRHRLFDAPQHGAYRVVCEPGHEGGVVVTCAAEKHGGRIAYVMEAFGGKSTRDLLNSELGRLCSEDVEVALAWCFPWSPNYPAYRKAGFFPLPERFRPIEINFGSKAYSSKGALTDRRENWYLSYLDSDVT